MTRTLEERQTLDAASAIKRRESKERRVARKQAATSYVRTLVASGAAGKQPRERNNIYLAWLRRLPCVAGAAEGCCVGPVEAAHLRFSDAARGRINSGMQAKPADRWATPLCNHHHQHDQHKGNERAFWDRLGIDPGDLCEALHAAFLAGQEGAPVVRRFAQEGRA